MAEDDRYFSRRRHCRLCRSGACRENDIHFFPYQFIEGTLQLRPCAFDVLHFQDGILSLFVSGFFEPVSKTF